MNIDPRVALYTRNHPFPLIFATISGAHLYGFPSDDSDFDIRGSHILPLREVLKMSIQDETLERNATESNLELDIVSHDVKKFFALLLKNNGYVLEQLTSPLIIQSSPEHEELLLLVPQIVTKHHGHHYLGFAESQWRLFMRENPPRIKPLLYIYRVLLTGIHLMKTGTVQANLSLLNETYPQSYIEDLIDIKKAGQEQGFFNNANLSFHEHEYLRLRKMLENGMANSSLPESPTAHAALDDLLVRVRLKYQ